MALDKLEAMRAFCRIVELGGFSKAAEDLGIAKTTVSGQIQLLEERLGVSLLHRSTRRVSPTSDGLLYYEQAKKLLDDVDELELSMKGGEQLVGKIKVETTAPLASNLLMPNLPDFMKRHPDLELEIRCTERAVDLVQENVDVALRGGPVTEPDLVCIPVGEMRFCLCASGQYLAENPPPVAPKDLKNHRYLHFRFPATEKLYQPTLRNGDESYTIDLPVALTFNNADVYCNAALAGLGIIAMPRASVQSYFDSGQLVEVLPDWQAGSMPISIVYPYSRRLSMRVKAFVEWAKGLFEGNGLWGR